MSIGGGEVEAKGPEEGGAAFVLEGLPPPQVSLAERKIGSANFPFSWLLQLPNYTVSQFDDGHTEQCLRC